MIGNVRKKFYFSFLNALAFQEGLNLERALFSKKIFNKNPNMCFVHTFPMELEYTIYFLSANPFCYLFYTLLLSSWYEEPCLITRSKLLLLKKCEILV